MSRHLIMAVISSLLAALLMGCEKQTSALPAQGHWRVVNYWAIWCGPCREEIPELNRLHDGTGLVVFAVNYDGKQGEALTSQAAAMGIDFTILTQDPGQIWGLSGPMCYPRPYWSTLTVGSLTHWWDPKLRSRCWRSGRPAPALKA